MDEQKFVWVVRSEDTDGRCLVFQLHDGAFALNPGDLVGVDGETFPVVECCYVEKDSPEARLINALTDVRFVDVIYRKAWDKNG